MKIFKFIGKNFYKIAILILLIVLVISITKIAFAGIDINSVKRIDIIRVKIDDTSKINIIGNDLGIHDDPLWIHVETPREYNDRLDKSIRAYEHDYKMQHDENYRKNFNEHFQKWKKEHNIE